MEFNIVENVVDEITGQKTSINFASDKTQRVRITLKEGVENVDFSLFGSRLKNIDDGISTSIYSPQDTGNYKLPVGETIVMYLQSDGNGISSFSTSEISEFLSQVRILHDPIPFFRVYTTTLFDLDIVIDSLEFEAPNGIFDVLHTVRFEGSSFKKGPKIFSEKAMSTATVWPYNDSSQIPTDTQLNSPNDNVYYRAWRPFNNCFNLETIENQGTLGENIKYVQPCDLIFKNEDGTDNLSAYPKMEGAPTHIIHYIGGESVKLSEIPNTLLNTSKCTHLYYPLSFNEYILDDVRANNLPFAGIDITGKDMKLCSLDTFNLTSSLETLTGEYRDFTFSLAHLGVFAPKSTNVCENLHTYYMSITEEKEQDKRNNEDWIEWKKSQKNHLLTPESIKEHVSEEWGEALIELWNEEFVDTVNQVPALPAGVQRLQGYMNKEFVKNDFITLSDGQDGLLNHVNYFISGQEDGNFSDFSTIQRYMHKDGDPFLFEPRKIELGEGERLQITNLYRNLFANLVIDEEVFIPKIPDNVKYLLYPYAGMFANSCGLEYKEYQKEGKSYTPVSMYTKSSITNGTSLNVNNYPMKLIKDDDFSDEFFSNFNRMNSEYAFACVEGTINDENEGFNDFPVIDPWGYYNDSISYSYEGYNDDYFYADGVQIGKINSKADLLNFIHDRGQQDIFLKTKRFNHSVNFEENTFNNLFSSAYSAHQLFYGSNPHLEKGKLIPIFPDSGRNALNYSQAFNLNYLEYKMQRPIIIQGYFEVNDPFLFEQEEVLITNAYKWAIILFFEHYDISEIDPSFSSAENLIPSMPSSRELYETSINGLKVQQYRAVISQDLIDSFLLRENELGQILSAQEIETPFYTFFGENTDIFRDPAATVTRFIVGLGLNRLKANSQHELKNPTSFTTMYLALPLNYCNMSQYAIRTFNVSIPFDAQYAHENTYDYRIMPDDQVYTMTPSFYSGDM